MDQHIVDFLKEDIRDLKADLKEIGVKVDQLLEFKWKVIGGTVLASLILTGLFQIVVFIVQIPKP